MSTKVLQLFGAFVLGGCAYRIEKAPQPGMPPSQNPSQAQVPEGGGSSESLTPSYSEVFAKVFQQKCETCHGDHGFSFADYSTISSMRSLIYTKVTTGEMPKRGSPRLTAEEYNLLILWLQAGAPFLEQESNNKKGNEVL